MENLDKSRNKTTVNEVNHISLDCTKRKALCLSDSSPNEKTFPNIDILSSIIQETPNFENESVCLLQNVKKTKRLPRKCSRRFSYNDVEYDNSEEERFFEDNDTFNGAMPSSFKKQISSSILESENTFINVLQKNKQKNSTMVQDFVSNHKIKDGNCYFKDINRLKENQNIVNISKKIYSIDVKADSSQMNKFKEANSCQNKSLKKSMKSNENGKLSHKDENFESLMGTEKLNPLESHLQKNLNRLEDNHNSPAHSSTSMDDGAVTSVHKTPNKYEENQNKTLIFDNKDITITPISKISKDVGNLNFKSKQENTKETCILNDVIAYIDVRDSNKNKNKTIVDVLKSMGSKVKEKFTTDVTHVIFVNGSKTVFDKAREKGIHLVSTLWIEESRQAGRKVSELLFPTPSLQKYLQNLPQKLRRFDEEDCLVDLTLQARDRHLKATTLEEVNNADYGVSKPQHDKNMNSPLYGQNKQLTEVWEASPMGNQLNKISIERKKTNSNNEKTDCEDTKDNSKKNFNSLNGKKHENLSTTCRRSIRLSKTNKETILNKKSSDHSKKVSIQDNLSANDLKKNNSAASIFTNSSQISTRSRRHRLYTVDCGIDPPEELVVPSTPEFSVKLKSDKPHYFMENNRCSQEQIRTKKNNRNVSIQKKSKSKSTKSCHATQNDSVFLRDDNFSQECDTENDLILPSSIFSKSTNKYDKRNKAHGVCLTSFHTDELYAKYPIIKKLGGFLIQNEVDSDTSHVVCGQERRTLNVLLGIAYGCWILDVSWLYESLEHGCWLPEEPFELFNFCPGAKVCRERKCRYGKNYKNTLFLGVGCIFITQSTSMPYEKLLSLLKLFGAQIVFNKTNANLIICNNQAEFIKGKKIMHVSDKWSLDCIQKHCILPFNDYKTSS